MVIGLLPGLLVLVGTAPAAADTGAESVPQDVSEAAAEQVDDESSDSRTIHDIHPSLDYAWGNVDPSSLPENFAEYTDNQPMERVIGTPLLLQWRASNLWYHPLYFEDAPMERYGHTYDRHIQYLLSPARFIGQTALLPYHMSLRPVHSREYPLGWYRPGERAPYLLYRPAWNTEAAIHEAGAVTGLFFLIP